MNYQSIEEYTKGFVDCNPSCKYSICKLNEQVLIFVDYHTTTPVVAIFRYGRLVREYASHPNKEMIIYCQGAIIDHD